MISNSKTRDMARAFFSRVGCCCRPFNFLKNKMQLSQSSHSTDVSAMSISKLTYAVAPERHALRGAVMSVVYVSEGTNNALLDDLAEAAQSHPSCLLLRQFRDRTYHRTGFTIGGMCPFALSESSLEVSRRALRGIDLRMHEASHPRIGVVDHISVHPLGPGSNRIADEAGMIIGKSLGAFGLPVLLYGNLKQGRRLAEVRRATPYFSGEPLPNIIDADLGPNKVDRSRGMVTVGCTPLVANYNVLLDTREKRLAARVTSKVREKDGGLPWVEALTLQRDDGRWETACNLLRPKDVTPSMVLAVAEKEAAVLGVGIVEGYETGLTEEQAISAVAGM